MTVLISELGSSEDIGEEGEAGVQFGFVEFTSPGRQPGWNVPV